jgi:hypothetical protein
MKVFDSGFVTTAADLAGGDQPGADLALAAPAGAEAFAT